MFQELLKKIATALTGASIPYMVIGGQSVLLYGEARLTKDIDLTLGVGTERLNAVKSVVDKLGFKILVEDEAEFVKKTMVLPVKDETSGIRIDLIFSFSPYERQAIERANKVMFGNTAVMFASLEDVVIHKMVAGRPRDLEDVKSILLKNPGYDREYILNWLNDFDASLKGTFVKTFKEIEKQLR